MKLTLKKLRFAVRIWALFIRYKITRGKSRRTIEKMNQLYMDYFYFLENTADPSTQEGQDQIWRARAMREELYFEGQDFWKRGSNR